MRAGMPALEKEEARMKPVDPDGSAGVFVLTPWGN
jgi:hypothetical protein